jgi:hypothetical protein
MEIKTKDGKTVKIDEFMTRKVSRMYKSKLFGSNPINPREAQE